MAGENTYHFIGKLLWRVINDYRRTALKFN